MGMTEAMWWGAFGRFFENISKTHARFKLEQDIRDSVAQHGPEWLLDYVLDQDGLGRTIPPPVYRVMSEHDWAERMGTPPRVRWILTMKGRQALSERKEKRDWEQAHAMLTADERRRHPPPRELPVLDQIRRFDAEWSD